MPIVSEIVLPHSGDVCRPSTKQLMREMLTQVGDKWTTQVVSALSRGPLRFGVLETEVAGISHRMLARTLRSLERDGLVLRTAYPEVPPRVEYELTDLGRTLLGPISALIEWVDTHQPEVEANRAAFDS